MVGTARRGTRRPGRPRLSGNEPPRSAQSGAAIKVDEPYERFLWIDLRTELQRRRIRVDRRGPRFTKAAFIELLRNWDKSNGLDQNRQAQANGEPPVALDAPSQQTNLDTAGGNKPSAAFEASVATATTNGLVKPPVAAAWTSEAVSQPVITTQAVHVEPSPAAAVKVNGVAPPFIQTSAEGAPRAAAAKTNGMAAPVVTARQRAIQAKKSPTGAGHPSGQTQQKAARAIRTRRGCRFRLINVLLSPDFNLRWKEMITRGPNNVFEVNQFWLDVHVAFNQQNSLYDSLHFQDALFGNISPDVVLPHPAARLLQIWVEIVSMYRTAVRGSLNTTASADKSLSFFDFCAGRLDLLYLHMAMLLEPELYNFVMSDVIPTSDPSRPGKLKFVDPSSMSSISPTGSQASQHRASPSAARSTAVTTQGGAPSKQQPQSAKAQGVAVRQATQPVPAKQVGQQTLNSYMMPASSPALQLGLPVPQTSATNLTGFNKQPDAHNPTKLNKPGRRGRPKKTVQPDLGMQAPTIPPNMAGMPIQNPEMEPLAAGLSKTSTAATTSATGVMTNGLAVPHAPGGSTTSQMSAAPIVLVDSAPSAMQSAQVEQTHQNVHNNPPATEQRKTPDQTHDESNGEDYLSSDYETAPDEIRRTRRVSKRPREPSSSTEIVEIPSVSNTSGASNELIPHPNKRFHATTTMSTAIAPVRQGELMLPPDEWDILENRLRKVNENIDRCHRALAGIEANVSNSYRQTLDSDLRFYSAIKQRLQEQLLVVMQSGY